MPLKAKITASKGDPPIQITQKTCFERAGDVTSAPCAELAEQCCQPFKMKFPTRMIKISLFVEKIPRILEYMTNHPEKRVILMFFLLLIVFSRFIIFFVIR